MRTTLTLEDDVAARLGQAARKRRQPMKAIVNEARRASLATLERTPEARGAFRTTGFNLGPSLMGSLDDAANHAAPEHAAARTWLDAQLSGGARIGLP